MARSRLVVSLSGLTDARTEVLVLARALAAELAGRGVPLTHLVQPQSPVGPPSPQLVAWLRSRLAAGDALALHGFDHNPDPLVSRPLPRIGRRAEFAALPRHEAGLRLIAARRALTAIGLVTDVFVPPRWLASPGTVDALREQGFAACATESEIRIFAGGEEAEQAVRARALGFRLEYGRKVSRRRAETLRGIVLHTEALRTARRAGVVRIGMRAKDVSRSARVGQLLTTVDAVLAEGARPTTYSAFVPAVTSQVA